MPLGLLQDDVLANDAPVHVEHEPLRVPRGEERREDLCKKNVFVLRSIPIIYFTEKKNPYPYLADFNSLGPDIPLQHEAPEEVVLDKNPENSP